MKLVALLAWAALVAGCAGSQNRPLQLVAGSGPVYPAAAKAAGLEGDVVVRYDVSTAGEVVNARVDRAEPAGLFEDAALAAVRSWRYNPQIRDGEPREVTNVVSTVRFRLDDADVYDGY